MEICNYYIMKWWPKIAMTQQPHPVSIHPFSILHPPFSNTRTIREKKNMRQNKGLKKNYNIYTIRIKMSSSNSSTTNNSSSIVKRQATAAAVAAGKK